MLHDDRHVRELIVVVLEALPDVCAVKVLLPRVPVDVRKIERHAIVSMIIMCNGIDIIEHQL